MNTRRTEIDIVYKGVNISKDLSPYLLSFTYNDNEGKSDEIQLDLEDRQRKWQGPWLPGKGDSIKASIVQQNWKKSGDTQKLDCGTFFVDDVSFKGPPDMISIKALSVPFPSGGKDTEHTRHWENTTLSSILGDVAGSSELSLMYDAPSFLYDRVDQVRETDLSFAKRVAKKEGLAVKVSKNQLIVYSEVDYEGKSPIRTITRGRDDVKSYSFNFTAAEQEYKTVEVSYFDDTKKKQIKYVYSVPGVEKGPTLRVNKRAKSVEEAKRWAKAEARAKNKGSKTGKITMIGDVNLYQGSTVKVKGFGAFDGKYYIETSSHRVTGGYSTELNLREVLNY